MTTAPSVCTASCCTMPVYWRKIVRLKFQKFPGDEIPGTNSRDAILNSRNAAVPASYLIHLPCTPMLSTSDGAAARGILAVMETDATHRLAGFPWPCAAACVMRLSAAGGPVPPFVHRRRGRGGENGANEDSSGARGRGVLRRGGLRNSAKAVTAVQHLIRALPVAGAQKQKGRHWPALLASSGYLPRGRTAVGANGPSRRHRGRPRTGTSCASRPGR